MTNGMKASRVGLTGTLLLLVASIAFGQGKGKPKPPPSVPADPAIAYVEGSVEQGTLLET